MIFGGYSIIFDGDFHQLLPVKVKENKFYMRTAIVLNNSYRFKDITEFEQY